MQKRRGFTTVELVIVIAVIAILATALIPTFAGLIDSANHNADIQTARNLSTQVMMYAMENEINDEADLRKALDAAMGEGFYDALEPKSAKKGYCYWYDYNNCQIVLGTIEEIIAESQKKLAVPSDWDITMANGITGNKDFAAGNMRTMVIPGYFLMAREGDNDLTKIITSLEKSLAGYCDGLVKLEQLAASFNDNTVVKPIMDAFVASVKKTPILTGSGLFLTPDATEINNVYVPFGTDELANTTVHVVTITDGKASATPETSAYLADKLVASFKLKLPQGTKFGSNVLNLERVSSENNPFLTGSDEIHINIEENQLGEYFFADVTDAVIVLPTGRYIQNGTDFAKLTNNGEKKVEGVKSSAYGTLQSFAADFVAVGASGTYVLKDEVSSETKDGVTTVKYNLYVSADHLKDVKAKAGAIKGITITANSFRGIMSEGDQNQVELPVRSITWETTGTATKDTNGLVSTITGLKEGDKITLTARTTVVHEYTIKVTQIDAEDFYIDSLDGNEVIKPNTSHSEVFGGDVFELTFDSSTTNATTSWVVKPNITLLNMFYNGTGDNKTEAITLDKKLTWKSSVGDESLFTFDPNTNTLSLIDNNRVGEGELETLNFTCNGVTTTIKVKLFDTCLAAFETDPIVTSMSAKGNGYVVGTQGYTLDKDGNSVEKNVLTLENLFKLKASAEGKFTSYELEVFNTTGESISGASIDLGTDWKTYPLQAALHNNNVSGQITLKLSSYEGVAHGVTVYVAKGACNVSNADEWAAAPTETDIAILDSFDITISGPNNKNSITDNEKTRITADSLKYTKFIGNKTVYGNYKTINVNDAFMLFRADYPTNYIIGARGGRVERVIINGPDYGRTVAVTQVNSTAMGTHVSGIKAWNGATVESCFISGFRQPLTVTYDKNAEGEAKVTVKDTTLHRGNFANLNVEAQITLKLDNVTTIQYEVNDSIGSSIVFRQAAAGSIVEITNGLKQQNYITKDQIMGVFSQFVNSKVDELVDGSSTLQTIKKIFGIDKVIERIMQSAGITDTELGNLDPVKHSFVDPADATKTKVYYNAGMIVLIEKEPAEGQAIQGITVADPKPANFNECGAITKDVFGKFLGMVNYGFGNCSATCTCKDSIPSADNYNLATAITAFVTTGK